MLALVVLTFIAVDVVILLVYGIYSGTQGTLEAVRMSNRERMREEMGVRDVITNLKMFKFVVFYCNRCRG